MTHKKAGVILATALLLLSLGVFLFNKIEFSPKEKVSTGTSTPAASTSSNTNTDSSKSESVKDSDLTLVEITAEDKLNYSSPEQTTLGKVTNKKCYLLGTQVVYAIKLEATMGTAVKEVEYFCTYSVYNQVSTGESLTISYKQTTENTFAVMSVTRG